MSNQLGAAEATEPCCAGCTNSNSNQASKHSAKQALLKTGILPERTRTVPRGTSKADTAAKLESSELLVKRKRKTKWPIKKPKQLAQNPEQLAP
jgi:SOS response regulatory protein OraA/RecX